MTMSAEPTSVSEPNPELAAALAAGWRRCDLEWEQLQEAGNAALLNGEDARAVSLFLKAYRLAFFRFRRGDPRYATSLANAGLAARMRGRKGQADRRYDKAMMLWGQVPNQIGQLQIKPRARSSLFHLRMEARHWETYRANMEARLGGFVGETSECLQAIAQGDKPLHRLYARWRGEQPSVFDDTRKLLAAALLLAAPTAV
ncbi:hypothetical protein [Pelagibius sp. Alg239-R121]|uniref:hypothetical protein n=1 Tax=Pelagibius sp. Alg239-R121 TaxID=2993448 RepID=UPI0024A667F0|nr:hypothetical protein [Pelagibius sp. Alg239-R121]